jgi:predicted DNA-binding transcriptional regulator YafY
MPAGKKNTNQKRAFKLGFGRILFIDKEIREWSLTHTPLTCPRLADNYEVSSRTIMRDIEYMRDQLGAPIEYSSKKGWHYTEENYALPAINVNEGDLFAICIAEKALDQYKGTAVYEDLDRIFRRIIASLPDKAISKLPIYATQFTMVPFPTSKTDGETWQEVFDALQEKRCIAISYQKPSDEASSDRKIFPLHAAHYHGAWYILSYCHDRKDARVFNLSRIKKVAEVNESEQEQKDRVAFLETFDLQRALSESFDMYIGQKSQKIKIRFSAAIAPYIQEREWHAKQQLTPEKGGTLLFEVSVNNLTGMVPWILSWGANATVLEPRELVVEIENELKKLVATYNGFVKD